MKTEIMAAQPSMTSSAGQLGGALGLANAIGMILEPAQERGAEARFCVLPPSGVGIVLQMGFVHPYCNTIPTPHWRGTQNWACCTALLRGLKDHADRIGQTKRASALTTPTTSWTAAPP